MAIFAPLILFVGLYFLWLMFNVATYALPFYAGLTTFFWLHNAGQGFVASIIFAIFAAGVTLGVGQVAFHGSASTTVRTVFAALFTLPAAVAGFQLVRGFGSLLMNDGAGLMILSAIGGIVVGAIAWTRLATPSANLAPPTPIHEESPPPAAGTVPPDGDQTEHA